MMTCDDIHSLLEHLRGSGLPWDTLDHAEYLSGDPVAFEALFREVHSKVVCEVVYGDDLSKLPGYLSCGDAWLESLSRWRLQRG